MERERPFTLKIWLPITIITLLYSTFYEYLPRFLTPPPNLPPELLTPYMNARLALWGIVFFIQLIAIYGVWIGNRLACVVMYILLAFQLIASVTIFRSTFWLYEALLQIALLAFSWKYFFG